MGIWVNMLQLDVSLLAGSVFLNVTHIRCAARRCDMKNHKMFLWGSSHAAVGNSSVCAFLHHIVLHDIGHDNISVDIRTYQWCAQTL